ncbi:T9SS type A sorting domain-containing protein [bacterium]|nr:T9SS type A sorting domain-containing protein [bacterium]
MARILALLLVLLIGVIQSNATPYWTEEQIEAARSEFLSLPRHQETGLRAGFSALDDIAYFVKYRQLCDFLDGLQVTTPGANFGGMREGEVGGDFSIVQTDNTQEAIRVWSQYAIWTGDTARYGENIHRAWVYNTVWPAWREEGGGYYAMHNCGWGFEAAAKFREAYGDTSMNWYADSCALWVVANTLAYNENGTAANELNPCAQGLGTGGLYPHSLYRNRTDWQDQALLQGRRLRRWFESRPDRLNNNLNWALCGGTALWGVCQSVFLAYPDSGALWLDQYGSQLETWENPSQWYNAFNTWYSNATFRCWEITGDSLFWNRGVFYADSLLGFDVDDDGGIPPGTCCISNGNDHSWVSAYMGWMGLERIISSGPIAFASLGDFQSPNPALPYLAGDSLAVGTSVLNQGTESLSGRVWVWGPSYSDSADFIALPGEEIAVPMSRHWVIADNESLPDHPRLHQRLEVIVEEQTITDEDSTEFDIRHGTSVWGQILGPHDPFSPPPCRIDFFAEAYPDSIWTTVDSELDQPYNSGPRPLLEGTNRMVIYPPARYTEAEQTFVTIGDPNPDPLDFWLTPTDVLLVDDDFGEDYEEYFLSSMAENGWNVRSVKSRADSTIDWWSLRDVPWMLWMTGDSTGTFTYADTTMLRLYLEINRGGILATGQDLYPALVDFGCWLDREDTDRPRAWGISEDPNLDDEFLVLVGTTGAHNQTSPSSIIPGGSGFAVMVNDTNDNEVCGVASDREFSGRTLFFSFGIEAISGLAGSTTRAEFLDLCRQWLMRETDAPPFAPLPSAYTLSPAYPNPFNNSTSFNWTTPTTGNVSISVFDVLGRQVEILHDGVANTGYHRTIWNASSVASGTYFVRLQSPTQTISRSIRLVK